MGWIPTHGQSCKMLKAFRARCRRCAMDSDIVYFECSCGSKFFLDPNQGWKKHECESAKGPSVTESDMLIVGTMYEEERVVSVNGELDEYGRMRNHKGYMMRYHKHDCEHVKSIYKENAHVFPNRETAEAAGYKRCQTCNP